MEGIIPGFIVGFVVGCMITFKVMMSLGGKKK